MSDAAALVPDLNEARRFLHALEASGRFQFQTFDDSKDKRQNLARTMYGTLDEHAATLQELNAAGAGVFVTVNRTDGGGRKAANVVGVRALFIDGDGIPLPSCSNGACRISVCPKCQAGVQDGTTWHCEPSLIVMRDAMHWHAYWLLAGELPVAEFAAAQKRLIEFYGSDKVIHDLPRVMRLPGFWHRKGEPRGVRVTFANDNLWYAPEIALQGLPELASASVVGGGDFSRATVSPAGEGRKAGSKPTGPLTEEERAERYARCFLKGAAPASGQWNNALKDLVINLCSNFKCDDATVARVALEWSRGVRAHDSGKEAEAQRTVQSVIASCTARGLRGNKWRPPLQSRAERGETEFDGRECRIDGLDEEGSGGRQKADEAPAETTTPAADASEHTGGQATRGTDDGKKSPPIETVSPEELDDLVCDVPEDAPDDDDPHEAGTLLPKLPVVPSGDAAKWFDTVFEATIDSIVVMRGTRRDVATLDLLREISKRIVGISVVTRTRVKERFCKALDFGRRDFEKAIDEASLSSLKESASGYMGLARMFLADLKSEGRAWVYWLEDWYQWTAKSGSYRRQGRRWIESKVALWLASRGIDPTTGVLGDFFVSLRAVCILHDDVKNGTWLNAEEKRNASSAIYLAMRNGILNLCDRSAALIPHTPDYFTLHAAPFDYDPDAKAPTWAEAVCKWHAPDAGGGPEGELNAAYLILQDWMGYLYVPFNPHKRFMVNVGPGNDGKSIFSGVCRMLIGERNCAAVGLEQFDPSRTFGLTPLLGTMLNIIGDANRVEKVAEGTLKSLTGNDSYTFDRKNRDPITDVWAGKIMINANEVPNWRGRSDALYNRMLTLNWNPIPASEINTNLLEDLRAEASGIFNWAMHGFDRIRQRPFVVKDKVLDWLEATRRETQHEIEFFEQSIEIDFEHLLSSAERAMQDAIVKEYVDYCRTINAPAFCHANTLMKQLRVWIRRRLLSEGVDGKEVEEFLEKFHAQERKLGGKKVWVYKGLILLKNEVVSGTLPYSTA